MDTGELSRTMLDIIVDPQTSGGLLLALGREEAERYVLEMRKLKREAYIIGEVNQYDGHYIEVRDS